MTKVDDPNGDHTKEFKRLVKIFMLLLVGISGNFLALVKLARKQTSSNTNYTLLLRCLMANNLIGLLGVTTLVIAKFCISKHLAEEYVKWICAGWVIFRFFGLSSGCIAMVMAVDRYMALTHPFYYHQHFRDNGSNIYRNAIQCLTFVAAVITFLPFVGFGLYFNENKKECQRYREAETINDRAYAILFFVFGTLICIVIVTCNTFVMRILTLRKSESIIRSTSESELKFAKLMAFLSLSFVICWMPQMISIIFALKSNPLPLNHIFYKLANFLMGLNFTLDPYVYVLFGKSLTFYIDLLKCLGCCRRRPSDFQTLIRTSPSTSTDSEI